MSLPRWFNKALSWLRLLLHRREVDEALHEELQFHLDAKIELNIAKGMTPERQNHKEAQSVTSSRQTMSLDRKPAAELYASARFNKSSPYFFAIDLSESLICANLLARPFTVEGGKRTSPNGSALAPACRKFETLVLTDLRFFRSLSQSPPWFDACWGSLATPLLA
jgi:hypothetical protein